MSATSHACPDRAQSAYDLGRRLELFPLTTRLAMAEGVQRLTIAGCDLVGLAGRYGTPLYLYDQATLDAVAAAYRQALDHRYAGEAGVTFAGKAFLCGAMARWVQGRGLCLDCSGAGELAIAAAAGVERERLVAHGVNKSSADLEAALAHAGAVVVDNLTELERWAALADAGAVRLPDLWLRLRPGFAVDTHVHIQTGHADSKFGMSPVEMRAAVQLCRRRGLPLTGLHSHLGSQFRDAAPVGAAIDLMLDLMKTLGAEEGWLPQVVCPGGGWGVAYHEDDLPQPDVVAYVRAVAARLTDGCRERGLPLPRLQLEPGRSLVARAGVALYRVGAVKRTAHRRWLLLDGGLADNPRPALYGARYTALPVCEPGRPAGDPAWLAGPYCESGDVWIEGLPLPDVQPEELLAVPVSGAYQLSMSSNYNGALRPAVVWLEDGSERLILRREEVGDLLRRDVPGWLSGP